MSLKEPEELQWWFLVLMKKGLVRDSGSPCAVPALLVPKNDGTWHICVDNRVDQYDSIKYCFPIPCLNYLDQLYNVVVFSKIDLRSGYHQIRM